MMNRTLKPRITKDNFSKWTSGMDSFYDEDPEAKLIKQENQDYRDSIKSEVLEDLYDIILKHKKELRKIPQCSHINGAQDWARKRRLEAREADLDHDGTRETVVWDRSGRFPYIVNGYKLSPSKQPLRKLFQKAKREGSLDDPDAGYRGYVRQLYGAGEWNEEGIRLVGVSLSKFSNSLVHQISIFEDLKQVEKNNELDIAPFQKHSSSFDEE